MRLFHTTLSSHGLFGSLRPMRFQLESLLSVAVERKASDLLLVPGAPPTIRVNGDLAPLPGVGIDPFEVTDIIDPVLSGTKAERFREGQAVDFCFDREGIGRFRCNLHRTQTGVAAALRILPEVIPDFDALSLPSQIVRFADQRKGFVLVAGPTGAGKSTTLACMVNRINHRRAAHIITIEDPVEYRHPHRKGLVEQMEVGSETPSFAEGLRHALRQNPDVILVGEMRDLETIAIAVTAAETGHLVLSTLHTNDTIQSIDRIIDVFPAHQQNQIRQQIAMALTGVVAQSLVPAADEALRVPAVEILVATDAVRNLIRTGKTHQIYSMLTTGRAQGMQTMEESLVSWVRQGRISAREAMAHANRPEEFQALLGG